MDALASGAVAPPNPSLPEPYYASPCGRAVIYHGDCLDVLTAFEPGAIDAFVTDPPYCSGGATESGRGSAIGQGLRSKTLKSGRFSWFDTDNMTTGGLVWLLRGIGSEALRVLPDGGSAVMFADWRMVPTLAPAIESSGLRYQNLLVWNKGSMGLGTGFRMQHEMALHFTKGVGSYHDRSIGNVLTHKRPSKRDRLHPTEKPVDLMAEIVSVVAPPGGTVIDPFGGSGSTGAACLKEGRRFIGVERSEAYADISARRLEGSIAQGSLFSPEAV